MNAMSSSSSAGAGGVGTVCSGMGGATAGGGTGICTGGVPVTGLGEAGAPATGFHLAIGRLAIVRGTLSYTDPRTGKTTVAEEVRAQASVGSFEGPFTIAGTYAKRFAAKEALAKALGDPKLLSWSEIEIVKDELGKPSIQLHGQTKERVLALGISAIQLSLSHEQELAVAFVVLEAN